MKEISELLKEAMKIRGINQTQLAQLSGIAKSTISEYLRGKYEPKRSQIQQLAMALNVNEAWLIGLDGASFDRNKLNATLTVKQQLIIEALNRHPELESVICRILEV